MERARISGRESQARGGLGMLYKRGKVVLVRQTSPEVLGYKEY